MVDEDKQACHTVAEQGYQKGMWPESYITWDFFKQHHKAMEPGYLYLDWNHIPGMYCRKNYLRSLVIEQAWDRLSDPAYLAHYWVLTQEPGDFHQTLALVLCRSKYSDCEDKSRKEEFVVSVAVIRKLVCLPGIPFASVADEFSDPAERESTLLIIRLHCQSKLFPDIYFDRYSNHFTMMHISGEQYNVRHPQKYVGPCSTMLLKLGESHNPQKLNCLRPTWAIRCTNFQWIPVCGRMKIG